MLLAGGLMAQNVQVTPVQIGETTANGYTINMDKDIKVVEQAMQKRLKEAKLKTSKAKPFTACMNQTFPDISAEPVNFYYKLEETGKKKERTTELTICVIPNNLISNQEALQANVRRFVEGFPQYVARVEAGNNMDAELDNLKKAQKEVEKAQDELAKLEKDIKKAQDNIASKKKDLDSYKSKIEATEKDIKDMEASIKKAEEQKGPAQKKIEAARDEVKKLEAEVERYRKLTE